MFVIVRFWFAGDVDEPLGHRMSAFGAGVAFGSRAASSSARVSSTFPAANQATSRYCFPDPRICREKVDEFV